MELTEEQAIMVEMLIIASLYYYDYSWTGPDERERDTYQDIIRQLRVELGMNPLSD